MFGWLEALRWEAYGRRFSAFAAVFLVGLLPILSAADDLWAVESRVLRKFAIQAPLPAYPSESRRYGRQGSVVAKVTVSTSGAVESAEILEAAEPSMGSSVVTALKKWRFSPFLATSGKRMRVVGRLVFYFRIVSGDPEVVDAAAAALNPLR